MFESAAGRIFLSLFRASVFLCTGSLIGFSLGLAYLSHLYGTPPVVTQIQSWLGGGTLYEVPLPAGDSGNLMQAPLAIIPKIGACIGFAIAASVLWGSLIIRALLAAVKSESHQERSNHEDL